MLFDLYRAQYAHEEYERRVLAHRLERAVLRARAERANALLHSVKQCFRLATGLAIMTWRRWRSLWQRVRRAHLVFGKPSSQMPN